MAENEESTTSTLTKHQNDAQSCLSDYERMRASNIERNNARLRELGLITVREEQQSNDLAWKRRLFSSSSENNDGNDDDGRGEVSKKKRKRTNTRQTSADSETTRKSLRVQGKDPEGTPVLDREVDEDDGGTLEEIRQQQVVECREARQLAALRYSQLTDAEKRAAKENPTATYEHCLKRVRTMTEKALYNRVRAIERATGKHCVVKMVRTVFDKLTISMILLIKLPLLFA